MTATNRLLLALVLTAAAVSAFWFLGLAPKREQAAELQSQIDAQTAELRQTQADIAGYERARAAYSSNYATVVRLGKAVPADDDLRSLLVQLDDAAARSGVDFESIDVDAAASSATAAPASAEKGEPSAVVPGTIADAAGFSTLPLSLSFKGSYFQLTSFFAHIERFVGGSGDRVDVSGRLLTINNITLQPSTEGFPEMRAQIAATSYLVPEEQGITNGATPSGPKAGAPAPGPQTSGGAAAAVTTATMTGAIR